MESKKIPVSDTGGHSEHDVSDSTVTERDQLLEAGNSLPVELSAEEVVDLYIHETEPVGDYASTNLSISEENVDDNSVIDVFETEVTDTISDNFTAELPMKESVKTNQNLLIDSSMATEKKDVADDSSVIIVEGSEIDNSIRESSVKDDTVIMRDGLNTVLSVNNELIISNEHTELAVTDVHIDNPNLPECDVLNASPAGSNIGALQNDYVTEEEIATSLKKKEDIDSLSLAGSCTSDSISQISGISKTKYEGFSLDKLRARKNELISKLQNHLENSSQSSTQTTEEQTSDLNSTFENLAQNNIELRTSTPFRESVPPAAKFLKKWKPTFFSSESLRALDKPGDGDCKLIRYDEEMASLQEILSTTNDELLDTFSKKLDAYKVEDSKKFDEMMLQITSEDIFSDAVLVVENDVVDGGTTLVPEELKEENIEVISISSGISSSSYKQDENDETLKADQSVIRTLKCVQLEKIDVAKYLQTQTQAAEEKETPKDAENLIIDEEGDISEVNLADEDLLLASDEEKEVEPEKKVNDKVAPAIDVKDLEIFISDDPHENDDNNDPKWEYLKNLGTDYDRYKAVCARWKNLEIPNPKKDLTCRCYKTEIRVNGNIENNEIPMPRENSENNVSRKRPHSPDDYKKSYKKTRRESCTIIFDRNIKQLIRHVEHQRLLIEKSQEVGLNDLANIQAMEKLVLATKPGVTELDFAILKQDHIRDTEKLIQFCRQNMKELMDNANTKMEALRGASEEVRTFHEFYPSEDEKGEKNSRVLLTEEEVQEILEVEDMLLKYESFYSG